MKARVIFFIISFVSFVLKAQDPKSILLPDITDDIRLQPGDSHSSPVKSDEKEPVPLFLSDKAFPLNIYLFNTYNIIYGATVYNKMISAYRNNNYREAVQYANMLINYPHVTNEKAPPYDAFTNPYENWYAPHHKAMPVSTIIQRQIEGYGNITVVYTGMQQYEKALQYLNIADSIIRRNDATPDRTKVWLLCIRAYISEGLKKADQTIALYDSAYKLCADPEYKIYILYHKIILLTDTKQTVAATTDFEKLIPLLEDVVLPEQKKAQIYAAGGQAYYNRKEYGKAVHYLQLAYKHIYTLLNSEQRVLWHQLAHAYSKTSNYKNAFDIHLTIHRLEDSIKSKEALILVNKLETRYRTATKDQIIAKERLKYHLAEQKYYREWIWIAAGLMVLFLLLLLLGIRYYYVKQKKDKLEVEQKIGYLQSFMAGEEKERDRMARELHDGVNSSLAATHSYLHTFEQLHPGIAADIHFFRVKNLLLSTANEIRAIAHNLTPNVLIKDGVTHALQEFCKTLFPTSIAVEIQSYGQEYMHSEQDKLLLYRMAQELLHTIRTHTDATEIIIMVGFQNTTISLTIEDNGIDITSTDGKNISMKLVALKEKLAPGQGRMNVEVQAGKGRVIHIVFSLHYSAVQ